MPKPDRMLKILQLLSHRRVVSLETIMSNCRIPERTAYRYLNAISDANIPVSFDKQRGGYVLSGPVELRLDDLTLQEIVLLVTSLRLVRQFVNETYRQEFDSLISRVVSRQPYVLESLAPDSALPEETSTDGLDFSEDVSFALIQAAIAEGRNVTIHTSSDTTGEQSRVEVDDPRLMFDGGWGVSSVARKRGAMSRLRDIEKISLG